MALEVGTDHLNWASFPSSLHLIETEMEKDLYRYRHLYPATPGQRVRMEVDVKQKNVSEEGRSGIATRAIVNGKGEWIKGLELKIPPGTFDWTKLDTEAELPEGTEAVRLQHLIVGKPEEEPPSEVWFDNLKLYIDEELVHFDKFSDWKPYQIGGVIAVALVGGYATKRAGWW